MTRINIRTVNGENSPGLNSRYARVQNRAAAVIDFSKECGIGLPIDLVAHLHRISVKQIEADFYGNLLEIKRRYGV